MHKLDFSPEDISVLHSFTLIIQLFDEHIETGTIPEVIDVIDALFQRIIELQ
jgi:hypothetical protein